MKVCILLVLGVIACNLNCTNGFRKKRDFDAYCRLDESFRRIIWNCIEDNLPFDERQTYIGIARCYDVDSFVDVLNKKCGKTLNEIIAMVAPYLDCLEEFNMTDWGKLSVDFDVVAQCVENKLR
ncbi:uncharacterized protein [Centruroides vittatus]|uniref:uncharacterized protein n=1 Tax=Centruroides vittatus TaxID=120091 RepID=UPI003510BF34